MCCRLAGRHAGRQLSIQAGRQAGIYSARHEWRKVCGRAGRHVVRQPAGRQTGKQVDRQAGKPEGRYAYLDK
jgi:hypothetical protein